MDLSESEREIIKECVKAHPKGYEIMFADDQLAVISMCLEGHPQASGIMTKMYDNPEYFYT